MGRRLKIMMIAAEMAPFAKTGGLGDVVGALPKYLAELGHEVKTFVPKYGPISDRQFGLRTEIEDLAVPMERWQEHGSIRTVSHGGGTVHFVASDRYFERDGIYGYADDGERFVFACRGALEAVRVMDWRPDVIHCHDWHTGLVPNWLKTIFQDDAFFKNCACLLTIHNLAFQGIFGWDILEIAGIAHRGFIASQKYPERSEMLDFLARGIIFADKISTVSERYAREILTPEYGERLDEFLREREHDLSGILNGIDTEQFDPATDPHLAANYDASSFDLKQANKRALQAEAKLEPNPGRPLFAVVSRLSQQKGMDLLVQALPALLRQGAQFVMLGTGDAQQEEAFNRLAAEFPGSACAFVRFDLGLAQRIYGGADALIVPSRFEPCGLTQMIAMRYGAVPVVRATGGLADTVVDHADGSGTGFSFERFDPFDCLAALVRATESYHRPQEWRRLALRCMAQDFSWRPSAKKYEQLYERMIAAKRVSVAAMGGAAAAGGRA